MKELFTSSRLENKSEVEKKYINLAEGYFLGSKKFDTLTEEIENTIKTTVTDEKNIMSEISEPSSGNLERRFNA